ncbi:MAG: hypothetical protein AAF797_10695 [Planctomycetota bacterium]
MLLKRTICKGLIVAALVLMTVVAILVIRTAVARAELAETKAHVYSLISVGQPLEEAQKTLTQHGYELAYETPSSPTGDPDYTSQLVIVGDTSLSALDSYCYAAGISNPLSAGVPYVVLRAGPDGKIYRLQ